MVPYVPSEQLTYVPLAFNQSLTKRSFGDWVPVGCWVGDAWIKLYGMVSDTFKRSTGEIHEKNTSFPH